MPALSSDIAVALAPFAGTLVLAAIGLAGVVAGRRVARELGPNTLMHYPAWGVRAWIQRMQEPTLTARQVTWLGSFLLAASPLFAIVLHWDVVSPWARARRAGSACIHLVTDAELRQATGIRSLERTHLSDDGARCHAFYGYRRAPDDPLRTVVTVSLRPGTFPGRYMGKSPIEQVAEGYARKGAAVEDLPALGEDAFAVRGRRDQIVFERYGVPVEIEIDETEVDSVDIVARVTEHVAGRLTLLRPYASP